ncbi:MAG: glutamate-5-semialdehyde dehydrogenase [Phycisphaerales bacterium]
MGRTIEQLAHGARVASRAVASLDTGTKNAVVHALAGAIEDREAEILGANEEDLAAAVAFEVPGPKLKRLELTRAGLAQMREGLLQIERLPDPVGEVTRSYETGAGLMVERVRAPLGVVAMIYEARPGVTIDAFALCFKAGNACVLKGGREANRSNHVLASIARGVLRDHGVPEDAVVLITSSDREEMKRLLTRTEDVDLVIPRGGEGLIRFVREHSKIPTVQHDRGVCHCYVDARADLVMALEIVATGKTSAPATCNSLECVLIHEAVAPAFVPMLAARAREDGFEVRGDKRVLELAPEVTGATPADFGREYLDLVLAARVVPDVDRAIEHIHRYGSNHTEAIVTGDAGVAERFCREVQSSCVVVNASTRFNDGFSLGLGAEIGISTSRVHAYGPMGLEELTCQRWVVRGAGQTR